MKQLKEFNQFTNLDEMIRSEEYQNYESGTLLNIQYHIINTDKNIEDMLECNKHGMFGCTHGEFIECYQEFLDSLSIWESKYNTQQEKEDYDISLRTYNKIAKQIKEIESWHINHFTYNDII